MNKPQLKLIIVLSTMFFAAHIFLARSAIKSLSPTYDEPVHLTAGYIYLKTMDYRMNGIHHPPLAEMWAALPLLVLNPFLPKNHPAWTEQKWDPLDQYRFSDAFLFKNRVDAEKMMAAGRWMQVGLSTLLGIAIAIVAWYVAGLWAAFYALGFWAFSPTFLTHGTIISTDIAFTFFFFIFFASLLKFNLKRGAFLSGITLGLCLSSKYFALSLFPIVVCLLLYHKYAYPESSNKFSLSLPWQYLPIALIGVCFSIFSVYQLKGIDLFISGLKAFIGRTQAGRSSFLWGTHSEQGHFFYFPFTVLVKTPIPILLGFILSVLFWVRKKINIPPFLWIPPLLFLFIACFSKVQIGHRYVLVIYPFLFVMAGIALANQKWTRMIGGIFLFWTFLEVFMLRPHYIAYFNQFVGGPSEGYRFLTDSNNDWGQALKPLSVELEREDLKNGIYLSYFGVVNPHFYGITYFDVGSDTIAGHQDDSLNPQLNPTKFAISVTNRQSTYYLNKNIFSWLDEYRPWKIVGHSIFVYDFKDDPSAIKKLKEIRAGNGHSS